MTKSVKLSDLTEAVSLPEDWGAWLDRETGAVIMLDPETIAAGEFAEGSFIDEFAEESLLVARAIASGDARYIALPDSFDFHEYRHMERWIAGIVEPRAAEQLWRAIKGRSAFRNFKDTIDQLGLREEWFAYRDRVLERFMLDWAEAHGVPVDRTPPSAAS